MAIRLLKLGAFISPKSPIMLIYYLFIYFWVLVCYEQRRRTE
jgi:hypothetical protein